MPASLIAFPRRRLLSLSLFLFLLVASLPVRGQDSEFRTFTNSQGKTIEARILRVDGGQVSISVRDGTAYTIPLVSLSYEDQAYIAKWQTSQTLDGVMPSSGQSGTDASTSASRVNELLDIPLFGNGSLWEEDCVVVATRLQWREESKTDYASSYRLYPGFGSSVAEAFPYSVALFGEGGKPVRVSIVFANKRDFYFRAAGGIREAETSDLKFPGDLDALNKQIDSDWYAVSKVLTIAFGEPSNERAQRGDSRLSIETWKWNGHAFHLTKAQDNYLSLSIEPVTEAKPMLASDFRDWLRGNVEKRDNGDVIIQNVPASYIGPRNFHDPAAAERCLRYMGMPADLYLLAMKGNDESNGNSGLDDLFAELSGDLKQWDRKFETWSGELKLRDLAKYLDNGIPIIWSVATPELFDKTIKERLEERRAVTDWDGWKEKMKEMGKSEELKTNYLRGHKAVIYGYNPDSEEIVFSINWGKGHEEFWLTAGEANCASFGRFWVIDL